MTTSQGLSVADYPVTLGVTRPHKFRRHHVFIRCGILAVFSLVAGISTLLGIGYLSFPIIAALFVGRHGSQRFLAEDAPRLTAWVQRTLALHGYLNLLTDRFPTKGSEEVIRLEIQAQGKPTVGSALFRIVRSLPAAFAFGVVSIIGAFFWILALLLVLFREDYPQKWYDFLAGVLRWEARLLAYHASLVDRYPPFALEKGAEGAAHLSRRS